MTIVEFLQARIAEDEAALNAVPAAAKQPDDFDFGGTDDYLRFTMGYGRALAEYAAKRAIVDLYERHRENRDARRSPRAIEAEDERAAQDRRTQEARTRVAEDAIFSLAAVYKDHPDYQQEWNV